MHVQAAELWQREDVGWQDQAVSGHDQKIQLEACKCLLGLSLAQAAGCLDPDVVVFG